MKRLGYMMIWLASGLAACAEGTSAPPAVAVMSGEVASLLSSGRTCLMDGKMPEAQALFEKVRKLDPANNEAAFGLSAACIELKRYEEALPILEKLNQDVPDNPRVKNNLAWTLLKVKDPAAENAGRAIKLARSALLDSPSDYTIWNTLGEAYYAAGQFEKALRTAQGAWRLSLMAGDTNSTSRELVARCRKAAGAASLEEEGPRR
ncbi:MAG: tetratricopeptide repeat protein [bacterium]